MNTGSDTRHTNKRGEELIIRGVSVKVDETGIFIDGVKLDEVKLGLQLQEASRRADETIKMLEEARRTDPRQMHEPLDAAWLCTLPEKTRMTILTNRNKYLDTLYGPRKY